MEVSLVATTIAAALTLARSATVRRNPIADAASWVGDTFLPPPLVEDAEEDDLEARKIVVKTEQQKSVPPAPQPPPEFPSIIVEPTVSPNNIRGTVKVTGLDEAFPEADVVRVRPKDDESNQVEI